MWLFSHAVLIWTLSVWYVETKPSIPPTFIQEDTFEGARNDIAQLPANKTEYIDALQPLSQIVEISFNNLTTDVTANVAFDSQNMWYQGDIMLQSKEEYLELISSSQTRHRRAASHAVDSKRWPRGEIPFTISAQYNVNETQTIRDAIKELNDTIPCLHLNEVRRDEREYTVHISFNKTHDKGCSSYIGYKKDGKLLNKQKGQVINLSKGCLTKGVIQHELMHCAGFYHEQSRSDRDEHVDIIEDNIIEEYKHNFDKHENQQLLSLPYDFESLVHYSKKGFAIDRNKPTIEAKHGQTISGQRDYMRQMDVLGLKMLYNCAGEESYPKTSGCEDHKDTYGLCSYWARNDLDGCEKFSKYMHAACKKTCNKCDIPTTTTTTTTTSTTTTTTTTPAALTTTSTTSKLPTTTKPTIRGVEDIPCNWPHGQQYFPHPTNCKMFIQCTPSGPQEMPCASKTAWEQKIPVCDHDYNVNCN